MSETNVIICEKCAFRYGAEHTLEDGSYSCPVCELAQAQARCAELQHDIARHVAICSAQATELSQAQTELAGSRRIIDELKERCAEMEKALREIALMGLTMPLEMSMAPDEWYKRRAGGAIKIAAWALDAALKEKM